MKTKSSTQIKLPKNFAKIQAPDLCNIHALKLEKNALLSPTDMDICEKLSTVMHASLKLKKPEFKTECCPLTMYPKITCHVHNHAVVLRY